MHPHVHAAAKPDHPAVIVAETGAIMTFGELEAASNRVAQFLRAQGMKAGDTIALIIENTPQYFPLIWGAQRCGVRFVCASTRLTADEINYILNDSQAKLLIVSAGLSHIAEALEVAGPRFSLEGAIQGYEPVEPLLAAQPDSRIDDEIAGTPMLYSSGTTGRPKGVIRDTPEMQPIDQVTPLMMIASGFFGLGPDSIYLSTAPLYHAAPMGWTMTVHQLGGTVVLMKKFDAEAALAAIDRYRCNSGQFVPTHFVRMLKLPEETRAKYDVSSMKHAIHAAAPCPVPVKQAMIEWWGPVIEEYYAGTEGNGFTAIKSEDWLSHPGSVGKAIGEATLHICDEDGNDLPPRGEGSVFFEGPRKFAYHNDPEKTAQSRNAKGWSTLGDVGYVDEEGYLYLTDRKSFMIISGGVNIYPQEIENHLVTHPKVTDVAVIGGPHEEMGEEVIAVIQPVDMAGAGDELRAELEAYAREKLSGVKVPRRIDFREELPRHDTGKLYKRLLRDEYWAKAKATA